MSESDLLLKQARSHALARRLLLAVNAASYIAAVGAQGLLAIKGGVFDTHLLDTVRWTAWPLWTLSLIAIFWTMARLRKRTDLVGLVDDERTVQMAGLAFKAGYWALLLGVTVALAVNCIVPLDLGVVAPLLLALGVAAPSLTYAALYQS